MYGLGASLPCRYLSFSYCMWIAIVIVASSGVGWGQDRAQMVSAPHPLITKAVDESQLATLKGNTESSGPERIRFRICAGNAAYAANAAGAEAESGTAAGITQAA